MTAWTTAEKLQLLLGVIHQVNIRNQQINWQEIHIPDRTTRAKVNIWGQLRSEGAQYRKENAGKQEREKRATPDPTGQGGKRAGKGTPSNSGRKRGREQLPVEIVADDEDDKKFAPKKPRTNSSVKEEEKEEKVKEEEASEAAHSNDDKPTTLAKRPSRPRRGPKRSYAQVLESTDDEEWVR
ncbi:uncharacterized protein GGS25DRAFT_522421 [Hypoxylon fragiforme]|uniref:uncharacterized protein n=1 Tax=Hypoxylon fragiforme TaxID=63214 RepID=UPI0020C6467B|nr:uncharacterized protein GGS25DRAFT_522421 [Hypoxylon fragiforme]KAI2606905.1 hypothetical protein GGS25DRAFT_522421 [Hypoxylon fragiforme]